MEEGIQEYLHRWNTGEAGYWRMNRGSLVGDNGASLGAQMVKHLPAMQETQVQSLCQEEPLTEERIATHYSIVTWEIAQTEEPGGLQSMGSQRVGHNEGSWAHTQSLLSSWILFFQLVSCTLSLKGRGELLCIWKESGKSYCWLSFRFPHTFKELCSLLMYLTHY